MIKFEPRSDCNYKTEYLRIFDDIRKKNISEVQAFRALILDDLWFIVYFVLGIPVSNHPFWVNACREVEDGPSDFTLDVWAREHGKTSILTIAETIQSVLNNPDSAIGIFSYIRPVAKKFLFELKQSFENCSVLSKAFPDVVWRNPKRDAPLWSLDEGLVFKRKTNRKEPTISAWGLTEGMPTGLHFERRVYDDIVTEDISDSIDTMEKVKDKFDSSQNLGTDGGTHRVLGTYYHHNDPLIYIRDKKNLDGKPLYTLRHKPATDTGTANGNPVYLSAERFESLKYTRSFSCQQLLDPTPAAARRLSSSLLKTVKKSTVPDTVQKFMTVDPAGDDKDGKGDSWAFMVVGIDPKQDEIGASDVYIMDLCITPMSMNEAIDSISRMYLRNGIIIQLGVEKVALSTIEIHIASALAAQGRVLSTDYQNLVILRPAGRKKTNRIESALTWPLYNGKIHINEEIPKVYRERLGNEMDKFPYWHDDGLDALSYFYDMINDYHLGWYSEDFEIIGKRPKDGYR